MPEICSSQGKREPEGTTGAQNQFQTMKTGSRGSNRCPKSVSSNENGKQREQQMPEICSSQGKRKPEGTTGARNLFQAMKTGTRGNNRCPKYVPVRENGNQEGATDARK
ncbi:hypothetical protein EKO25_09025 [Bacillus sp. SAJ1]|nr:hypothetical protein EKO25_09025 [Bacillus sp. SAJ1]